jgi:hypothetical protein
MSEDRDISSCVGQDSRCACRYELGSSSAAHWTIRARLEYERLRHRNFSRDIIVNMGFRDIYKALLNMASPSPNAAQLASAGIQVQKLQ